MKNSTLYLLIAGMTVVIVATAISFALLSNHDESKLRMSDQDRAIEAAQLYEPVGDCESIETQAVHESTGAKFDFQSACIPTGWVADPASTSKPDEPVSSDGSPVDLPYDDTSGRQQDPVSSPSEPGSQAGSMTAEDALREASAYQPRGACTAVITPARHIETGATYTFTSGCIPAGWERQSSR